MDVLVLVSLALLALAARVIHLRLSLAGWERLWRFTSGPITIELRRHAAMARLGNDSLEFPQPREFRTLSMRVGGIPLWSRAAVVGLPAEVDARLGEITAREFDQLFSGHFRMDGPKGTVQALMTLGAEDRPAA